MKKKIALIFGVTGQDGSYLSSFLIKKGYSNKFILYTGEGKIRNYIVTLIKNSSYGALI